MNEFMIDHLIAKTLTIHENEMAMLYFLKFTPGLTLTGSRSFGTQHEESDYDFFINSENTPEQLISLLRELGFRTIWDSSYNSDPSVLTVLEYAGRIKIHIQLIRPHWYDTKVAAQNKIKEMFTLLPDRMRSLSKEEMKKLWRRLYLTVD